MFFAQPLPKSLSRPARCRAFGAARRSRRQRGAAAVELALLGPLFFLLLLSIFDISIMSFRESSLRAATESGARVLRTGEVAKAADPQAAFVSAVCDAATGITCADIIFDVRPYANFTAVSFAPMPLDAAGNPTGAQFTSGTADQVLAVRLLLRHEFVTPYLEHAFTATGGKVILESTIIVQGEPWT
jgi:Flp pilus assembly protein TadG